jgi:hypothetical protein
MIYIYSHILIQSIKKFAVFNIMAIVGDYGTIKTWALVMPGGVQCTDHDMPDMPQVRFDYYRLG